MVEFRRDPDGSLWSYEEGVRIARVVTTEDILLEQTEKEQETAEGKQEPKAPEASGGRKKRRKKI
jgi:hypothetical protein